MIKKHVNDFALFGGSPVFNTFRTTMNLVPLDRDIFFAYAQKSFKQRQMTNNGPSLKELENQLARFHGVHHCIAYCNCFTAMFLALRTLALPGKHEVVLPSLTYRRMADIVDWAGLLPRFCDVDQITLGVTPETVEPCINENTALLLAPHPITNLCDIEGMERLAKKYSLPLFFDSVEACGGEHKGTRIGGFGDCEGFSMHPSKVINACEGGYLTTNSDALASELRKVRAFGFEGHDKIVQLGYNAKLNELHAAAGLSSLANIENVFAENRNLHLAYQRSLSNLPGVTVIQYSTAEKRNWKSLLMKLGDEWPLSREDTLRLLQAENIHARPYYSPPQHITFSRQIGRASCRERV